MCLVYTIECRDQNNLVKLSKANQQFHRLVQDAIKKMENRLLEERLVANVVLFRERIGHLIVRSEFEEISL